MGPDGHGSTQSSAADRMKGQPQLVGTFWHLLALFGTIPAARAGSVKDSGRTADDRFQNCTQTGPKSVQNRSNFGIVGGWWSRIGTNFTFSLPNSRGARVSPPGH